ncbi:Type I restriction modification DNA specificity domain protein [Coleofasciculus chthonoplastes PCC 7420]|uniref:Type I restriction modification DNA specificity domain protein n=2 Tax=Coleofasciculus chthonoplastes TaxID=64178 RepID=B4W2K6_9CYAN|nr:Type I restriction modification DNA specificity domain protein [Coleofasciculus chthonoplastes PCC 7420]
MELETFFEQFELLADAPNGVQKLRELILQLAVQGKLVPQNPDDEPASVLLERIREEKKRLVKEGKIKKGKKLPPIDVDEMPFELPYGWEWVRFDSVATIQSNLVKPESYSNYPHIAPDKIEKGTGRLLDCNTIQEDGVTSPKHFFFSGQILYSKIRPNLSKAVVIDFEGLCSADMYPIKAYIYTRYLHFYILTGTFLELVVGYDNRLAIPKVNQQQLNNTVVPVPPLPEQHRIVAKVDRLMSFCDELEAKLTQSISDREKLMETAVRQVLVA